MNIVGLLLYIVASAQLSAPGAVSPNPALGPQLQSGAPASSASAQTLSTDEYNYGWTYYVDKSGQATQGLTFIIQPTTATTERLMQGYSMDVTVPENIKPLLQSIEFRVGNGPVERQPSEATLDQLAMKQRQMTLSTADNRATGGLKEVDRVTLAQNNVTSVPSNNLRSLNDNFTVPNNATGSNPALGGARSAASNTNTALPSFDRGNTRQFDPPSIPAPQVSQNLSIGGGNAATAYPYQSNTGAGYPTQDNRMTATSNNIPSTSGGYGNSGATARDPYTGNADANYNLRNNFGGGQSQPALGNSLVTAPPTNNYLASAAANPGYGSSGDPSLLNGSAQYAASPNNVVSNESALMARINQLTTEMQKLGLDNQSLKQGIADKDATLTQLKTTQEQEVSKKVLDQKEKEAGTRNMITLLLIFSAIANFYLLWYLRKLYERHHDLQLSLRTSLSRA